MGIANTHGVSDAHPSLKFEKNQGLQRGGEEASTVRREKKGHGSWRAVSFCRPQPDIKKGEQVQAPTHPLSWDSAMHPSEERNRPST